MEINTIPFEEKQFLLGLLEILNCKFGDEQRHIFDHKFRQVDQKVISNMAGLDKEDDVGVRNKAIHQWFIEAKTRGFVSNVGGDEFKITSKGYETAKYYKAPVKRFCKKHWAWAIGIAITVINISSALVIKLVQC